MGLQVKKQNKTKLTNGQVEWRGKGSRSIQTTFWESKTSKAVCHMCSRPWRVFYAKRERWTLSFKDRGYLKYFKCKNRDCYAAVFSFLWVPGATKSTTHTLLAVNVIDARSKWQRNVFETEITPLWIQQTKLFPSKINSFGWRKQFATFILFCFE